MKTPALLVALFAVTTACAPTGPDELPDDDVTVESSSDDGDESGSEDDGATSTSQGSGESDSGSDDSGESTSESDLTPAECILEATGMPCIDVLASLNDGVCGDHDVDSQARADCGLALGRLYGSVHIGGAAGITLADDFDCGPDLGLCVGPPSIKDTCSEVTADLECGLTVEDTVTSCVQAIDCPVGGPPKTCASLAPAVVEALCVELVAGRR